MGLHVTPKMCCEGSEPSKSP
uniref:Uncharacterized protein n=1 Tax=Anguilla anguilla TaxID=7936 RepID=A0A0E9VGC9_ANGAN